MNMILFLIKWLFLCLSPKSYIGGLLVVINMMDVSGQAEVCYLHNVIFSYQDITGSQVSMNTLQQRIHACKLIKQIINQSHMLIWLIWEQKHLRCPPSWMRGIPCHVPPGRRRTPGLCLTCSPHAPGRGCSSTPSQVDDAHADTLSDCPLLQTPQWHRVDLTMDIWKHFSHIIHVEI